MTALDHTANLLTVSLTRRRAIQEKRKKKKKKKSMWAVVALLVLVSPGRAQSDIGREVDAFLDEDFEGRTSATSALSATTRTPLVVTRKVVAPPKGTGAPRAASKATEWLAKQNVALASLYATATQQTNETREMLEGSLVHFERATHAVNLAVNRFNDLMTRVRTASGGDDSLLHRVAPMALSELEPFALSPDFSVSPPRVAIFGLILVWFAVVAVLMVRHRRLIEPFCVVLLVLGSVTSLWITVFAGLEMFPRRLNSHLQDALEINAFLIVTMLCVTVNYYAVMLSQALYASLHWKRSADSCSCRLGRSFCSDWRSPHLWLDGQGVLSRRRHLCAECV